MSAPKPVEPYIKAIPSEDGQRLKFEMDQAGFDYFQRLLSRSQPTKADNNETFNAVKSRIDGAFFAGAVLLGWEIKAK